VTAVPIFSSKRALALLVKAISPLITLLVNEGGEEEIYYHTGMKLKLLRDASPETNQRCELSYSRETIMAGAKKPGDMDMDVDSLTDIEQAKNAKKCGRSLSE
jgi:hypothetical protein